MQPQSSEESIRCPLCEEPIQSTDQTVEVRGSEDPVHAACATMQNGIFYCWACHELVDVHTEMWCDEINCCQDCADRIASYCDGCDELFFNDNLHYTDEWGRLCDDCLDRYERAVIHEYSYKPEPIFHMSEREKRLRALTNGIAYGPRKRRFFGVEVEMECENDESAASRLGDILRAEDEFWYAKHDSSIGSYNSDGVEIVSHPFTWEWFQESYERRFKRFFESLESVGFYSHATERCGIHVHVNKRSISRPQLFNLQLFFHKHRDFIRLISQRRTQAQLITWADIYSTGFSTRAKQKSGGARYSAINLNPRHTVEFRIFNGNTRADRIRKNLEFVQSLLEFSSVLPLRARDLYDLRNYLDYVRAENYPCLADFLHEHNFF